MPNWLMSFAEAPRESLASLFSSVDARQQRPKLLFVYLFMNFQSSDALLFTRFRASPRTTFRLFLGSVSDYACLKRG